MVSNIEKFDTTAVLALAELYTRFPVRKTLFARDFILTDDGDRAVALSREDEAFIDDSDPTYSDRKDFAFETLLWLVKAGYIHGEPKPYDRIEEAVLTAKGLEVLKVTPDSLQGAQETLGEKLQKAAKDGIGAAGRALITQLVTLGVKYVG